MLSDRQLTCSYVFQLDDVAKARPEITKAVENMVAKGKWTVPGYTESASTSLYHASVTDMTLILSFYFLQSSEYVFCRFLFSHPVSLTLFSFPCALHRLTEPQ